LAQCQKEAQVSSKIDNEKDISKTSFDILNSFKRKQ